MSYGIPTDELTLTDMKEFRKGAKNSGIKRAVALRIAPAEGLQTMPDGSTRHPGLVVRTAQNIADFGCGQEWWLTMPLLVAGAQYSVFATAVPAALTPILANNRVAVFYKVSVETVPGPVSLLSFREGAAAGTTYAVFDLEDIYVKQVPEMYFSEPVVYDPQRVLNVVVTCRLVPPGVAAQVRLGCYIVEPIGPVIS